MDHLRKEYGAASQPTATIVRLCKAGVNGQTVPQGKTRWRQPEVLEG